MADARWVPSTYIYGGSYGGHATWTAKHACLLFIFIASGVPFRDVPIVEGEDRMEMVPIIQSRVGDLNRDNLFRNFSPVFWLSDIEWL